MQPDSEGVLAVSDVLPFKIFITCYHCSVVAVGKTRDNASFPNEMFATPKLTDTKDTILNNAKTTFYLQL